MSKNQQYAERYAAEAMEQMKRYGIPASVTLAQGILESRNGQSELSQLGNNHFGVKASKSWLKNGGDYLVYTDDKPNEKFCKYATVGDSYEHHSKILKNNSRYSQCFKLSPDDYKGWTKGIERGGYATNGGYAASLQKIIEINGLQKYDQQVMREMRAEGKKFDEKKFEQACANANRTAKAWLKVCDFLQYKPAPYSGFDLFNHMADVVTARATVAAGDAFELLAKDLEETVKKGETTTPFPEKYRVMFEGIPCWPKLPALFKPLKTHGVNVTAVVYAPAFGFVYNNIDEMARAYYKAPNSVCIEQGVDWREGICRDNKVDGVLVHYNRSCKPWSGYMAEMQRRFTADLGIPCAGFDGDQADPRNFNAAQYETRVEGLVEAMEANKQAKEAK